MIPMRSATTSRSAAFAPSSRRNRTAPRRSATTSGFIVSATASSGCSAISRSTAPSPHDMTNSPIASSECYISQPRVTGSNLSTRPKDKEAERARLLQRCRRDPFGDRTQRGAGAAALGVGLEHGELRVGGCARADDGPATVDLGGAAERRRVGRGVADHAFDHLGNRHGTILGGEGGVNAIALRLPLVFDDDGTS